MILQIQQNNLLAVCKLVTRYTEELLWGPRVDYTSEVAVAHPMAISNCNISMETLISAQKSSVATLAITTLLKTGNESSADHLMKQITNFMSDVTDECKIVVVEAARSLCLKFPLRHGSVMSF